MESPVLYLILPCYDEAAVLPETVPAFLDKMRDMIGAGRVSPDSRLLFVDDGSGDGTWDVISSYLDTGLVLAVRQNRNRGHQNALLAGYEESVGRCDVTVTMDVDGQDDIGAVDRMLDEYIDGHDVVYGVRSDRRTDTWFKRATAEGFYSVLRALGVDAVFNHGDFRLLSERAVRTLLRFEGANRFWRGFVPLAGYGHSVVEYPRGRRVAGRSHYPVRRMLVFASDGITRLTIRPLRMIFPAGLMLSAGSFVWLAACACGGRSLAAPVLALIMGMQTVFLGIMAAYMGAVCEDVRKRPDVVLDGRAGDFPERRVAP